MVEMNEGEGRSKKKRKKKGSTLVSDVVNGGGRACMMAAGTWGISVPSSQYYGKSTNVFLKIKYFKKCFLLFGKDCTELEREP